MTWTFCAKKDLGCVHVADTVWVWLTRNQQSKAMSSPKWCFMCSFIYFSVLYFSSTLSKPSIYQVMSPCILQNVLAYMPWSLTQTHNAWLQQMLWYKGNLRFKNGIVIGEAPAPAKWSTRMERRITGCLTRNTDLWRKNTLVGRSIPVPEYRPVLLLLWFAICPLRRCVDDVCAYWVDVLNP